ncbi:MAG: rod shape-determining protein MreD [Bacteroidota bacterium]|nr:rod shape-determining protein MreD [Bacteroidota bacterium]
MSRSLVINIIRFVFLVLLQVFVLNKINFNDYINPYLYILFILLFPVEAPKWLLLFSAFLMGFLVDDFMNTIGINMAATLFIAWMRPGLISLLNDKEEDTELKPGIKRWGFNRFFVYALSLTFAHHLILFYLEAFKFTHFWQTFRSAAFSTLITLFLIILSQYLFMRPEKK